MPIDDKTCGESYHFVGGLLYCILASEHGGAPHRFKVGSHEFDDPRDEDVQRRHLEQVAAESAATESSDADG